MMFWNSEIEVFVGVCFYLFGKFSVMILNGIIMISWLMILC